MSTKSAAKRRTASESPTVKSQLLGKLGPGGYGELLQKLHLMALPNADKTPAGEES
jgi:hypothetical protein